MIYSAKEPVNLAIINKNLPFDESDLILIKEYFVKTTMELTRHVSFYCKYIGYILTLFYFLNVHLFLAHQRSVDVVEIEIKDLESDNTMNFRELIQNGCPIMLSNCIAKHLRVGHKMKEEAFLKANLKGTQNC